MDKPMYQHNCDCCIFLGRFNIYDLYYHPNMPIGITIFARHGSQDDMIIDGTADNFIGPSLQAQAIRAAYHKALLAGYDVWIPLAVKDHPDLFPGLSDNDIVAIVREIKFCYEYSAVMGHIQNLVECTKESANKFVREVRNGLTDPLAFKERLIQIRHGFLEHMADHDIAEVQTQSPAGLIKDLEGTVRFLQQECDNQKVKLDNQSKTVDQQSQEIIKLKEVMRTISIEIADCI